MNITLNLSNFQKSYLRELIFNDVDKLTKRNRTIINLKTYKEKITSNLRDEDFIAYEKELSNNDLKIIFLNNVLEGLK